MPYPTLTPVVFEAGASESTAVSAAGRIYGLIATPTPTDAFFVVQGSFDGKTYMDVLQAGVARLGYPSTGLTGPAIQIFDASLGEVRLPFARLASRSPNGISTPVPQSTKLTLQLLVIE